MRIGELDLNVRTAGSGVPFLWAHGMLSSMAIEDAQDLLQWQHVPSSLRLVRYDARAHGATAPATALPAAPTWQQLGQDMLDLAGALGEDKFIAGGWSVGCAAALHAALRQPAHVKGLVLAMPPALWEARAAQAAHYRRAIALAQSMGSARFARFLASQGAAFPAWLLKAAPHLANSMGQPDPAAMLALYEAAAQSDLPPRDAFASLAATPALIVAWEGDPVHPLVSARELHRLLPGSSLFIAHDHRDVLAMPAQVRAFASAIAAAAIY